MLGEKIRKLRKGRKISQEELAEKLGVSRQSVSLWENGQTQPTIENIIAIAEVFGVATDDILKDKPEAVFPEEDDAVETPSIQKGISRYKVVVVFFVTVIITLGIMTFLFFEGAPDTKSPETITHKQISEEIASKTKEQIKEGYNSGEYDFYYKIDVGPYKGTVHHRSCYLLTESMRVHENAFPKVDMAFNKGYRSSSKCNCIK